MLVTSTLNELEVVGGSASPELEQAPLTLNTTLGSALHARWCLSSSPLASAKAYVVAAAATYAPVAAAAAAGPLPIASATAEMRLPFLLDWNAAFMLLVSFPSLVVLLLSDQRALSGALQRVQADGVVVVSSGASRILRARWEQRFRAVNITGQLLGAVIGALLVYFNYRAYVPETVGFWIARDAQLIAAGYVFLGCIFVFYAMVTLYVCRTLAIAWFLRDVVAHSDLQLLPFHPDRCGGLRPVGELGLRTQYGLSVFGLNLVLLVVVSVVYLELPPSLFGLIVAAAVGYVIVGPSVFIAPLLPFRAGMLRTKGVLMGELAVRLRFELDRLRGQLRSGGTISKEDEELIDRLRKVGAVIEELPVWPFDAMTLRKFLTAYVVPVGGALAYPAAQRVLTEILRVAGP